MRIAFAAFFILLGTFAAAPEGAFAQAFPTQPIRLINGGAVGGGWDLAARLLAERMKDELGQPVFVDSKPGADGILAASAVAAATPDGYTLMPAVTSTMVMNPRRAANSGYTFATETFKQQTGLDLYRIPYKGSAQTVTALVTGDVQVALIDAASALPQIKAGKIRALAQVREMAKTVRMAAE